MSDRCRQHVAHLFHTIGRKCVNSTLNRSADCSIRNRSAEVAGHIQRRCINKGRDRIIRGGAQNTFQPYNQRKGAVSLIACVKCRRIQDGGCRLCIQRTLQRDFDQAIGRIIDDTDKAGAANLINLSSNGDRVGVESVVQRPTKRIRAGQRNTVHASRCQTHLRHINLFKRAGNEPK